MRRSGARWRVLANRPKQAVNNGALRWRDDVVDGRAAARQALIGLLEGKNFGQLVVDIADAQDAPARATQAALPLACAASCPVIWIRVLHLG